ncbi:hypothetical protein TWF173_000359 [Orbilia oligospora]|uniref:Uncharacterized protein n=1 Tax=Orbilia oligospora TaxID=2813651 RepID=A0A7C8VMQ3_ORBOL|nr:hypothetical protein TWF970_005495 [Orbilia oligospora]KAF3317105.1 hypothetical protein TWF173_000359 [Orbilia oligospora]
MLHRRHELWSTARSRAIIGLLIWIYSITHNGKKNVYSGVRPGLSSLRIDFEGFFAHKNGSFFGSHPYEAFYDLATMDRALTLGLQAAFIGFQHWLGGRF